MGIWNTHVANGALYNLQFDVVRAFEPIALVSDTPLVIVARKGVPADDLKGLLAWLRTNDQVSVATAGVGSAEHLAAVLFQNMVGARFLFVPYRGSSPAIQDLIGGQVDMMFSPSVPSLPQIRAGTIKGYAVTSKWRLPAAPEIPSVDEAGLVGFHFSIWTSLWAPKGTPGDVIAKLNAAIVEALADPEVRSRLSTLGPVIVPREQQTPEALAALQKAEIEKWWPIIKAANVKGE
jgi:tripartite-type tricarboxylate transporter receptor subunit TctC